ncbi:hypothetical protein E2I00_010418 [Balaenoptera physalus]|uniref:Uncharacterized protein n=1 Tax=Balaenoptera physalus TaxID=9770 RepID=A0A643CDL9_BALPH|nr:hypothetical protein E2I00_010418 [Balaenoptera physalus]
MRHLSCTRQWRKESGTCGWFPLSVSISELFLCIMKMLF